MSDFAYNLNGEPFEVPPAAAGWRVRKLKAKGAPEVVYGRDGLPLTLPVGADMEDLRREARAEGRYRLDAVDEHSRPITGCPAGYVCLHDAEPTVEGAPATRPVPVVTTADQALVEAMRIQADLARGMLEAAATLLRAAENAGLPQRLPRFFLDVDGGEEREAEADVPPADAPAEPAPKSGFPAILDTCISAGANALVSALAQGKLKIPGGLGALIDCRRAVPTDSAAAAPMTFIPGVVPAPGPRDPAPAMGWPVTGAPTSDAAPPRPAAGSHSSKASAATSGPAGDMPAGLPTIDAATMQHFQDILGALTLHEQMQAQALAAELAPEQLRAWIHDLQSLSVSDAASMIRAFLGKANGEVARTANAPTGGGPATRSDAGPAGEGGAS